MKTLTEKQYTDLYNEGGEGYLPEQYNDDPLPLATQPTQKKEWAYTISDYKPLIADEIRENLAYFKNHLTRPQDFDQSYNDALPKMIEENEKAIATLEG